jgi:HD-GYP domain-containing protein (c-di-GMP phosphodiesterase class II)
MSWHVTVTDAARGRSSRAAATLGIGDSTDDTVVVATVHSLRDFSPNALRSGLWIVLGKGDLPPGLRPFLRLPAEATQEQLDLAVDAALEVGRLRSGAGHQQREATRVHAQQLELARVGIALTAERDLSRLLELILSTARALVSADAGSFYLVEERGDRRVLRFALAQNDSVVAALSDSTVELDSGSLAGHVALTGEPVNVFDVRELTAELPFRYNPSFDVATGYHTRSVLTTPISTRAGEVIGVLQLINRKPDPSATIVDAASADALVRPFGSADVAVLQSLAAQAAVAIENTRLVDEIEGLFEGFVRAAVTAIEQRDPSTSGHSLRVAHYTVALAQAVEQSDLARFAGTHFSAEQITQLRYAALLHDFGKVGVREAVLTKAKKLPPGRLTLVQERFRRVRAVREAKMVRQLLETLVAGERPPSRDDLERLKRSLDRIDADLDAQFAAILAANEPHVEESPTAEMLTPLLRRPLVFGDEEGASLLLPEELRVLSVPKGSLDEEERREIESHVVHSYQFLLTIPWPHRYSRIPEIVYRHHEKLNGRGYPNRVTADAIPVEARIMTVCDVYDALAAGDRPYKRAVAPERALAILEAEAAEGFWDRALVNLFIDARIFARPLTDTAVF